MSACKVLTSIDSNVTVNVTNDVSSSKSSAMPVSVGFSSLFNGCQINSISVNFGEPKVTNLKVFITLDDHFT